MAMGSLTCLTCSFRAGFNLTQTGDDLKQTVRRERRRRLVRNNSAKTQTHDPISHPEHMRQSVGDEDYAETSFLCLLHHMQNLTRLAGAQVVRRLIENDHLARPC